MAVIRRKVEGLGEVTFQKRKGARNLRIHINGSEVKVTLPNAVPYRVAHQYVLQKRGWVLEHVKERLIFRNGDLIGKSHRLEIERSPTTDVKTRVNNETIKIQLPVDLEESSEQVQSKIRSAVERALKKQANSLIIPRLNDLALENGFQFNETRVKKLKRRWGSCDSNNNITINLFLSQIPWELIDYVLIHELSHTRKMNHSRDFWKIVGNIIPDYKQRRKTMKRFAPEAYVF